MMSVFLLKFPLTSVKHASQKMRRKGGGDVQFEPFIPRFAFKIIELSEVQARELMTLLTSLKRKNRWAV